MAELVCYYLAMIVIKRESGINPEQSRCCEALYTILIETLCHWLFVGKAFRMEAKSEDLPFNINLIPRGLGLNFNE